MDKTPKVSTEVKIIRTTETPLVALSSPDAGQEFRPMLVVLVQRAKYTLHRKTRYTNVCQINFFATDNDAQRRRKLGLTAYANLLGDSSVCAQVRRHAEFFYTCYPLTLE